MGNIAMDSLFENEAIRRIVERHPRVTEEFRKAEYLNKIKQTEKPRLKQFNHHKYQTGEKVFFQNKSEKGWKGPAEVFTQKGNEVWLWSNGDLKRINVCRIQPFESVEDEKETKDVDSTATETSKEGVPKLGETKKMEHNKSRE